MGKDQNETSVRTRNSRGVTLLASNGAPVQFLSPVLGERDKALIKTSYCDLAHIDNALTRAVEAGYRVSIKWYDRQQAVQVSLQPIREDHVNFGLVACFYHRDVVRALAVFAWSIENKYDLHGPWGGQTEFSDSAW